MAGKQQQYQGALDSVYNVIFSQASKPPSKKGGGEWAKKIPGDPLSFALTEMAAKPWLFWGNTVKEIADGLHDNVKLTNFWTFGPGFPEIAKAKIGAQRSNQFKNIDAKTGEAPLKRSDIFSYKFLQSPLKFAEAVIDSTYQGYREEKKKFALAGLLGGAMDWVVGYGYASKLGLSPSERMSFAGASGYFTQGVGHYSQRLKMKAENSAMAINGVRKQSTADNYAKIIQDSLNASDLGSFFTADMDISYSPTASFTDSNGNPMYVNDPEIERRRKKFRQVLRQRLINAQTNGVDLGGRTIADDLLKEIEGNYFKEVGLFRHDESKEQSLVAYQTRVANSIISDMAFTPGALRETMIRNREMRIRVLKKELFDEMNGTNNPARINRIKGDLEKVGIEKEFMNALQLIKGDHEDYAFNFYDSINRVTKLISLNSGDPVLVARLLRERNEIIREKDRFMTSRRNNPFRMAVEAGGGRQAITVFMPNLDQKMARKAFIAETKARTLVLQKELLTPNISRNRVEEIGAELNSLNELVRRVDSLRGASYKNLIGNTIVTYNYAKALFNGKIYTVGNVLNGFVFWKFNVFSPGSRGNFMWAGKNKKFAWAQYAHGNNREGYLKESAVKGIVLPREFSEIGYLRYMTDLFYLRPGAILNTLFYNGEGFAYLANRVREKAVKKMVARMGAIYDPNVAMNPLAHSFMLLTGVRPPDVIDIYQLEGAISTHYGKFFNLLRDNDLINLLGQFSTLEAANPGILRTLHFSNPALITDPALQAKVRNFLDLFKDTAKSDAELIELANALATDPNIVNFINILRTNPDIQKLMKMFNRASGFANAANSVNKFFASRIGDFFNSIFGKVSYEFKSDMLLVKEAGLFGIPGRITKLSERFLSSLSSSPTWKTSVKQFLGKELSLDGLLREGVRRFLQMVGLGAKAGGPPGWLVAFLAWLASLIVDDLVKVVMKLPIKVARAMWAIVIIFFLLIVGCSGTLFSTSTPNGTNDPTSTEVVSKDIDLTGYGEFTEDYIGELGNAKVTAYGNEDPLPEYFFSEYSCMLNTSATCAQGSISVSGYSHYHGGKPYSAIDVTPGNYTILAPAEGRVTYYKPVNNCGKTGISYGGHLQYTTIKGDVFVMYHVKLVDGISVNSPDNIQAGEVIAILNTGLAESDCWTGPHAHIEVKSISTNYRYQCPEEFFYGVCDKMGQCKLSGDICKRKSEYK